MKNKVLIGSVLIFIIDQISKLFIVNLIDYNSQISVINNFFNITYVKNTGAAFNMFSDNIFFLIFATLLAVLFIYNLFLDDLKSGQKRVWIYALVFGGIFGNLVDRIFRGYVIDFFDFIINGYNFPIFNIGDIAIVVGTTLIVLDTLRGEFNDRKKNRK